jgi:hypothetical protein
MPQEPDDSQWYDDDEMWLRLLRSLDDSQVEHSARLFHRLAKELGTGTDGAYKVRCCLENARRLAFPFTKFARGCELLFQECLEDDFEPDADSLTILEQALQRKRAANERDPIPED